MIATEVIAAQQVSRLEVGIGLASDHDPDAAVERAAALAGARLSGAVPDVALVVTAGKPAGGVLGIVRSEFGPVGIAGGATSTLLVDHGPLTQAALVVAVVNSSAAVSGVAATRGRNLDDAGQAAARLILAGWPFRARYPRGLGVAFAGAGAEGSVPAFLESWRNFMGPKMRTVCSVLASPVLYGHPAAAPVVSVGCLEAPYATGIGYTDCTEADGSAASPDSLVQGAVEATLTALKRLDGRPARLVLVLEDEARHRALGGAVRAEWEAIRAQTDERTPCVGWLGREVAAYGRGVQPTDAAGVLVVVALGDSPRA